MSKKFDITFVTNGDEIGKEAIGSWVEGYLSTFDRWGHLWRIMDEAKAAASGDVIPLDKARAIQEFLHAPVFLDDEETQAGGFGGAITGNDLEQAGGVLPMFLKDQTEGVVWSGPKRCRIDLASIKGTPLLNIWVESTGYYKTSVALAAPGGRRVLRETWEWVLHGYWHPDICKLRLDADLHADFLTSLAYWVRDNG